MATKIQVSEKGKPFGSVALFDIEPSFELIHAIFPGPLRIVHDIRRDTWFVDFLDAPEMLMVE
jgi:hypothetical protein